MSNDEQDQGDRFPGEYPPEVGFRPELHGLPPGLESLEPDDGPIGGLETQCGALWDAQDVETYDGMLGVTQTFVNNRQPPVGVVQWNDNLATIYTDPGSVNNARWCTGTLIGDDLFLTAGHCFDGADANGWRLPRRNGTTQVIPAAEVARNMHVDFNFQRAAGGGMRSEYRFPVVELLEHRLGGLDYAIARLAGNPGALFGVTDISAADAAVNDMLCLIGHPAGQPKQIEAGVASDFTTTRIRYGDIDTLGGNSGSGLLHATTGQIIGVHTNGGCTATGGFNVGLRITAIIGSSPITAAIAAGVGEGEFYTTDGAGNLGLIARRSGWRRTWRHIVPGNFGGSHLTDLVFYDPVNGQGEFYASNGFGGITLLRRHSSWRQTWRHIIPGSFGGSGATDLLFYDPTTGEGEFYAVENGGMRLLGRHTGWRRDWKLIVPGEFGGGSFTDLLFYDATTGEGEFYATDGNGGMSLIARNGSWRGTWDQIVPGNFGGGPHTDLLFYDAAAGDGEFYSTDGAGGLSLLHAHGHLRTVWKHIVPGNFGGSMFTDLLFYDPTTGEGEFYATDGTGGLSLLRSHDNWRRTWRHIVPGDYGRTSFTGLLFYDPIT